MVEGPAMRDDLFELMRRAKARLVAADSLSSENRRLHGVALKLLYRLQDAGLLGLSQAQFDELAAAPGGETEGGGTPKSPPDEE